MTPLWYFAFAAGLLIGATLGIFALALLVGGSREDDETPVGWCMLDPDEPGYVCFQTHAPRAAQQAYLAKWGRPQWQPVYFRRNNPPAP